MATNDIRSDLLPSLALEQAISGNGTVNGAIVDTAKFDGGIMFIPLLAEYTDGNHAFFVEEGDDPALADATVVTAAQLIGTPPTLSAAAAEGDQLTSFGVVSNKRYLRLGVTSDTVTTGAIAAAILVMKGEVLPVEQV